ncbi:MAG TPA: nitroreductase family deazaflavin-dependent oxidoreductase [Mycobacteriales bacterium]|nr:nitroreductase family deazaflavin-dependent oxidoreductase [Mycobacteriales bacterium]
MKSGSKDIVAKVLTSTHRRLFSLTGGRIGGALAGMPVLVLTTTGRRSGRPRQTMLTSPVQEGERLVLVASYGGDDRHPQWFLNLRHDPDVLVTMGGATKAMRARVATANEKAQLWDAVTASYQGYGGYQRRTDRDIPLVLLDPVTTIDDRH